MTAPSIFGSDLVRLLAMLALAAPFVASGIGKLRDLGAAEAEIAGLGLRPARGIALIVVVLQLSGAALLLMPGVDWIGAGVLAGFTVAATLAVHRPWRDGAQAIPFWEHAAIAGGLLLVAVMSARGA